MAYAARPPRDPTEVLGRRITAYVIDGLLVLVGTVAVLSLVQHDSYSGAPSNACAILSARRAAVAHASESVRCVRLGSYAWLWTRSAFLKAEGVAALIGILNLVLIQAATGASIGKHAVGLRVVDEQGRKAGLGRTIVRWLFLIIDGGIFLIGLITALVTHPHRRVGDLAAGTYVIARENVGRPIGIAPATVPYGTPAFAMPGYGAPPTPTWAPPTAPAPAPPSWGTTPAPAPAPPAWAITPPPVPSPSVPLPPAASWNAARPPPPQSFPPPAPAPAPPPPRLPLPHRRHLHLRRPHRRHLPPAPHRRAVSASASGSATVGAAATMEAGARRAVRSSAAVATRAGTTDVRARARTVVEHGDPG